jgi:hypothetical protein
MSPDEMKALTDQAHAELYPNGCGGGLCEACVRRLKLEVVTCTTCGNSRVPVQYGVLTPHDRYVGGRRGYRARPQECEGSGRKP